MKATLPWHDSLIGRICRWLGSVQLAVPVLVFVAAALAWGTYLESTRDAKTAKALVYGSWWFLGLMVLVCASLIFAVVIRFPWKKKHVGFIVVHASLITMIVGGFQSLFGRIEGHLTLEQGNAESSIEMPDEVIELVAPSMNGQVSVLAQAPAPDSPTTIQLADLSVRVAAKWENTKTEYEILDNGPEPYRAVEIALQPGAASGSWVGEESRGGAAQLDGLTVHVLAPGSDWTPPAGLAGQAPATAAPVAASVPAAAVPVAMDIGYAFVVDGKRYPLSAEGKEAFPGWKIISIKQFAHATVGQNGLADGDPKSDNPAVDVTISDGVGTSERHTAFAKFPEMVLFKPLEGAGHSNARLSGPAVAPAPAAAPATPPQAPAMPAIAGAETLVIYGQPPAIKLGHVNKDGTVTRLENLGTFPWNVDLPGRKLSILKQFTKTQEIEKLVQAPPEENRRPALVIGMGNMPMTFPVAWKGMVPASLDGSRFIRYGPKTVPLPFTIRLDQFRKTDYPGTDMAMAYESSVSVSASGQPGVQSTVISMNNPLKHSGWKVYQSGFIGMNASVFSIMKDPGLPLTYVGAVGLCLGILVTFYSRGYSWGHPGIPAPFAVKEQTNASRPLSLDPVVPASHNGDGRALLPAVDGEAGVAAGSGRRPGDAARLVRP